MALSKTLAQLRTSLLRRAGFDTATTSVDLTSSVLNELINDAIYEAWDVIVAKWEDYFTTSTTISVVAGTATYAFPTLFYKLRLLEHADNEERLLPTSLDDKRRYAGSSGRPRRYIPMDRQIRLYPTPSSNETITIWYVPIKAEMTSDSDSITFDTPIELKYVLATAWRDILDRQNLDPSPAIAKMQAYEAKLRSASGLDATEPFYLSPRGPGSDYDEDDYLWGM